jgi:hypothetical protein
VHRKGRRAKLTPHQPTQRSTGGIMITNQASFTLIEDVAVDSFTLIERTR